MSWARLVANVTEANMIANMHVCVPTSWLFPFPTAALKKMFEDKPQPCCSNFSSCCSSANSLKLQWHKCGPEKITFCNLANTHFGNEKDEAVN